jgi:hypothetical protein
LDQAALAAALTDPETAQALAAAGLPAQTDTISPLDENLCPTETSTLGAWGGETGQVTA